MEVISATPNMDIATEILLGVYQEPVFPTEPVNPRRITTSGINLRFVSYDKFNERVTYSYNRNKTIEGYWLKSEEEPTKENCAFSGGWENNAIIALNITMDEFKSNYTRKSVIIGIHNELSTNDTTVSNWLDSL